MRRQSTTTINPTERSSQVCHARSEEMCNLTMAKVVAASGRRGSVATSALTLTMDELTPEWAQRVLSKHQRRASLRYESNQTLQPCLSARQRRRLLPASAHRAASAAPMSTTLAPHLQYPRSDAGAPADNKSASAVVWFGLRIACDRS
jgi:hypothetical protein